jgi:lipoprotein NlpI
MVKLSSLDIVAVMTYEPAVKAFPEVLRLDPKYPNATNQLGLSYFYLKRYSSEERRR